ncbi:GTP-binding protein ypt1 [Pelomyxa schiedti]|nr:GTP-binding protein ypt1 [Pelomyxa schiedti]
MCVLISLLLWDSAVGKTSLIVRYVENTFSDALEARGQDFLQKTIEIDSHPVTVRIFDTAGQERFATITSSYYRGASGIIVVYDITDNETFQNARYWIREIERYSPGVAVMLVGNKVTCESRSDLNFPISLILKRNGLYPQPRGKNLPTAMGFRFWNAVHLLLKMWKKHLVPF